MPKVKNFKVKVKVLEENWIPDLFMMLGYMILIGGICRFLVDSLKFPKIELWVELYNSPLTLTHKLVFLLYLSFIMDLCKLTRSFSVVDHHSLQRG